ncbi:hypothetical protein [Rufibacter psychrotolerans]|uniref:hypothetical protein n=1 Tax=Rufibacter psychrotolerans TaxID=2812556 RepID=UPI001966DAEC|nr:hypothetical protein [Rufibacter sp. SYSU D00308]
MLYIGFAVVSIGLFITGALTIEKVNAKSSEKTLLRLALFALILFLALSIFGKSGPGL